MRARTRTLLCLLLLTILLVGGRDTATAQLLGDADGNGQVDNADADLIADYWIYGFAFPIPDLVNSDVNRDGRVDMRDALAVGQTGVKPLVLVTTPGNNDKVVNETPLQLSGVALIPQGTTFVDLSVNGVGVARNADGTFNYSLALTGGANPISVLLTTVKPPQPAQQSQRVLTVHYLKVDNLSSQSGRPGEGLTITGAGFDPTPGNMFVSFYPNRSATITNITPTAITVTVPDDIGTLVAGVDGVTVVRKAKDGSLVPTKDPKAFFPLRHEQILNCCTIDPDSVKTVAECNAQGGTMINGFCIDYIAMHPDVYALLPLGVGATAPLPLDPVSTPDPVAAHGGTAEIEMETGWFYEHDYFSADPAVPSGFPLLLGITAADFTRVSISEAGQYDVTTILDNRNPAPLIYLQSPLDGTETQQTSILVYGSVNSSSVTIENVTLSLSYSVGTAITYFEQEVSLTVGDNLIRVTAQDGQGRMATKEVTVTRVPLVQITYALSDPHSGLNLSPASLVITLNSNPVPFNRLLFRDNTLGGAVFNPNDVTVKRYNVSVEFAPSIAELNNGQNTTTITCRDNAGNALAAPQQETFDATY